MCSVFSFSPLHKKAKDDNYFLEDFAQNIINILTSLNVVTLLNQIAPRFLPLCYHILSPAKQWMLTPGCIPMVSFFNVFSSFSPHLLDSIKLRWRREEPECVHTDWSCTAPAHQPVGQPDLQSDHRPSGAGSGKHTWPWVTHSICPVEEDSCVHQAWTLLPCQLPK